MAAGLRLGGRGAALRLGQPFELGFRFDQHVAAFIGEDVLAELRVEARQALVDLRELLLRILLQARPGAYEVGVLVPREALLLGVELRVLGSLVYRGDALEQARVLHDPVAVRG